MFRKGLEPNVTLFHYDLPQKIALKDGFANRENIDAFVEYAKVCFKAFGDRVKLWVTINEPKYYAYCSNVVGNYPPNHKQDFNRYFKVVYNEALATSRVVRAYHDMHLDGKIGVVHDNSNVDVAPYAKEKELIKLRGDLFYNSLKLFPLVYAPTSTVTSGMLKIDPTIEMKVICSIGFTSM